MVLRYNALFIFRTELVIMINVDMFRPGCNWKVEVTEDCIYHIDIIYEADEDIMKYYLRL